MTFFNFDVPISAEDDVIISEELDGITYDDIEYYNQTIVDPDYIKFEDMKPSTMTIVVFFTQKVDMAVSWHLLPIDYNPNFKRHGKKLLWPGKEGLILNCRYKLLQRGPCWKSSFKNSVNLDVTTKKIISLKISEYAFQMCGASSLDDASEASLIVINKINYVYEHQVYIRMYFDRYIEVYNYMLENSKGKPIIKYYHERFCTIVFQNTKQKKRKCSFKILKEEYGNMLVPLPEICPSHLDPVIYNFLYNYHRDLLYSEGIYQNFMEKLSIIHKIPYIYSEATDDNPIFDNQITTVNQIMVNYNYSFPKCIDRSIYNYIASKLDCMNVFSRYLRDFTNNVSVEYVYDESSIDDRIKRNKNKPIHQTSIIYKSGSITASCRSIEVAIYMYNIIKFVYCRYRDLVVDEDLTNVRKLEKMNLSSREN